MPTAQPPIAIHGQPDASGLPNEIVERQIQRRKQDDQTYDVDVFDAIFQKIKQIKLKHRTELLRRIRKWAQIIDFYHNRQWGKVEGGLENGRWIPADTTAMPIEDRVFLLSNNQIRPLIGTLAGVWGRSDPRILSEPAKESDQSQMMSRFGTALIDHYQEQYLTEDFRQREAKLALLPGNWLCYQYFDPTGNGESFQIKQTQPVAVKLTPDLLSCASCGKSIPAPAPISDNEAQENQMGMQESPQAEQQEQALNLNQPGMPQVAQSRCPSCSGPMILKPGTTLQGEAPAPPIDVPIGEVFTELVNPAEICLELRARGIQDSMYLLRTRVLPIELLEHTFNWAKVPQTSLSIVSWELKRLEVALGVDSQGHGGYGPSISDGFANDTELDEVWFEPPIYSRWRAKDDVQIGDVTVPAGTMVIDTFPHGLHAKYVDSEPLHLRPETKNDFWVLGKYDPAAEAIWADGAADDMIDPQIGINQAESLRMENLRDNAVSHNIFNGYHIDAEAVDGWPDANIVLNSTGNPNVNPNEVWSQIPGSELRGVEVFIENKKMDMRESGQAGAELAGNIQSNNRTARGVITARNQQVEQLGPRLAYRAYVECLRVRQMLKLKQANYVPGQYKDVLGDYSDLEEQAFIDGNVDRDLRIIAQDGSWLPRTVDQERNDIAAYIQLKMQWAQLGQAMPDPLEEWAQRSFNVPFSMEEYNPDNRIAVVRITDTWALIQSPQSLSQAGLQGIDPNAAPPPPVMVPVGPPGPDGQPSMQPTNPAYIAYANALNMLAAQIPVELLVDDHPTFIYKYRSYLKTDRGRKAPPLFRQILIKKIEEHMNAMAVEQQQQAARQAPLQIKTAQVQNDLQAENTAKQAAAQPPDDESAGE